MSSSFSEGLPKPNLLNIHTLLPTRMENISHTGIMLELMVRQNHAHNPEDNCSLALAKVDLQLEQLGHDISIHTIKSLHYTMKLIACRTARFPKQLG